MKLIFFKGTMAVLDIRYKDLWDTPSVCLLQVTDDHIGNNNTITSICTTQMAAKLSHYWRPIYGNVRL